MPYDDAEDDKMPGQNRGFSARTKREWQDIGLSEASINCIKFGNNKFTSNVDGKTVCIIKDLNSYYSHHSINRRHFEIFCKNRLHLFSQPCSQHTAVKQNTGLSSEDAKASKTG